MKSPRDRHNMEHKPKEMTSSQQMWCLFEMLNVMEGNGAWAYSSQAKNKMRL